MEEETLLGWLKVLFMVAFIAIVLVVGTIPFRMANFKTNPLFKSMGTTFAGALFINVAIVHILPESADAIQQHLRDGSDDPVFPLANLLVIAGFLTTIFFTRILSSHTHEEDHRLSHEHGHEHENDKKCPQETNEQSGTQSLLTDTETILDEKNDQDAYFLTLAMYFHTVFEGIAIGVQDTLGGFLSTAVAIAFHKWADALSMGIHYRNRNVAKRTAYLLIAGQAILNGLAIGFGWALDDFGEFVEAIFLSISAGTFLAISTMQMLGEQLHHKEYRIQKFLILLVCTGFVSGIWYIQNALFPQDSS